MLSIALFGMVFAAPRIFLYMPASNLSISCLFHKPAAAIGVPMYIRRERAKQQVSYYRTSTSTFLRRHLSREVFLLICSLETFSYCFLSIVTLTPKYFTAVVHLIPLISSFYTAVSISDFFLFNLRFHSSWTLASSSIIIPTSAS